MRISQSAERPYGRHKWAVYQRLQITFGRLKPVSLESQLKTYADQIDERLAALLPSGDTKPPELHAAMRYSCLAPGKRIRPILCMACAEAVGGEGAEVIGAACALEMLHCFSLIHDDLPCIDDDDLRRGLPTCHKKFGEAIAVLAGDALFSLAFEVLSHSPGLPERVLRCVQILTRASGSDGLVGGEVVDVLSEGKQISMEELTFIHSRKTGALMAASCEIGAILGGGVETQIDALREYGDAVGLAFQITDDVLNETADPVLLGKATGSDRAREKVTFATVYGLERATSMAAETATLAGTLVEEMPNRALLQSLARYTATRLH